MINQVAEQSTEALAPKDYFYLASHQFPQRGSFLEGWEIENTQTFYRYGIVASIFTNSSMKHLVIAFHMIDDASVTQEGLSYTVDFVKHAKQLAEDLKYHVSYTGKYQGGAIAEYFASQDNLPCYTFDSPAVQENHL